MMNKKDRTTLGQLKRDLEFVTDSDLRVEQLQSLVGCVVDVLETMLEEKGSDTNGPTTEHGTGRDGDSADQEAGEPQEAS